MIIGKDKERVRELEIQCELQKKLIIRLRDDLELIGKAVDEDIDDSSMYPYYRIWVDIGRCKAILDK